MNKYDVCIIGGGWAGFSAALEAGSRGLKTALIENDELGGTCLNRGCIPTKALAQSAKVFSLIRKSRNFGIDTANSVLDFSAIKKRKEAIVQTLRANLETILKNQKNVEVIKSKACLVNPHEISLGTQNLQTENIIIASGSGPRELQNIKFNSSRILSSDEFLRLESLPISILIIGGGVIGCEFASIYSHLGADVTIAEYLERLLPSEDPEISRKLEAVFKKRGIKIRVKTDASTLGLESFEKILLGVGRRPLTEGLGLENARISLDKGRIVTDAHMRTNIPNIYAAGDCTSTVQLAHVARHQAVVAVENIINPQNPKDFDFSAVPNCIFSDPEVSSIGLNELQAKAQGLDCRIDRFDFLASGMARIMDETDGFIKIISEKNSDKVIGASMIGPKVTELIAVFSVICSSGLKRRQIADSLFAHPTLSEAIGEAVAKI